MNNFKYLNNLVIKIGLGLTLSAGVGIMVTPTISFAATSTSSSISNNIINTGEQFLGTPYKYGSKTGDTSSFDCSSFTQYVYKQNGVSIPRSSKQQSQVGTFVPRDQLQPGDLVFFYSPIHHVGIYMGNGQFIHTYGAGGVRIDSINSGWWSSHYTTARRVILNDGQALAQNRVAQPAAFSTKSKTKNVKKKVKLAKSKVVSNQ